MLTFIVQRHGRSRIAEAPTVEAAAIQAFGKTDDVVYKVNDLITADRDAIRRRLLVMELEPHGWRRIESGSRSTSEKEMEDTVRKAMMGFPDPLVSALRAAHGPDDPDGDPGDDPGDEDPDGSLGQLKQRAVHHLLRAGMDSSDVARLLGMSIGQVRAAKGAMTRGTKPKKTPEELEMARAKRLAKLFDKLERDMESE